MSDQTEQPLACNLSEAQKNERRPKAEDLFLNKLDSRRETDNGYAFQFGADDETFQRVFEFVDAERKCCPFFQFQVTVNPDEESVWLEIFGSDRVKSFIADNLIQQIEDWRVS